MCLIEVVSSPSPWVFKFGREVVEGTWASRGVLHGPFSPEGERHPAPTLFPGIKSLTVYWSFRQHWEMLAGKSRLHLENVSGAAPVTTPRLPPLVPPYCISRGSY